MGRYLSIEKSATPLCQTLRACASPRRRTHINPEKPSRTANDTARTNQDAVTCRRPPFVLEPEYRKIQIIANQFSEIRYRRYNAERRAAHLRAVRSRLALIDAS